MTVKDPGDRPSRVEREIREILERTDAPQRPVDDFQAAMRRKHSTMRAKAADARHSPSMPSWLSPALSRIIGALVLAIAAAFISDHLRILGIILAIASAAVFFSLWVPARSSGLGGDAPRWRGQRLDDGPRFGFGSRGAPPWRGPRRPPR